MSTSQAPSNIFRVLTIELLAELSYGWQALRGAARSFVNPGGWGIVWFHVNRGRGYEQPMIMEAPGVLVVARDTTGRIALLEQHRANTPHLPSLHPHLPGYMKRFFERPPNAELERVIGESSIEVPGGIWKPGPQERLDSLHSSADYVMRSAEQEAREELGATDLTFEKIGLDLINPNPVFFVHHTHAVLVRVGRVEQNSPEAEEIIRRVIWRTPEEVRRMIDLGDIKDSRSIHALVWAGLYNWWD